VKLPPRSELVRFVTDTYGLTRTEVAVYRQSNDMAPGIRMPKVYFVDYNADSNACVLFLEHVDGIRAISHPPERVISRLDECTQVLEAIATWHTHFWGDVALEKPTEYSALNRADDLNYLGTVARFTQLEFDAYLKWCANNPDVAPVPEAYVDLMRNDVLAIAESGNLGIVDMCKLATHVGWTTFCQGAASADNMFQVGSEPFGFLEPQLGLISSCANDISWFFCTTCPLDIADEHYHKLIRAYYSKLKEELGKRGLKPPADEAELEEEVALSHILKSALCLIQVPVSSFPKGRQQYRDATIFFRNLHASIVRSDSVLVWQRAKAGMTRSFRRCGVRAPDEANQALLNKKRRKASMLTVKAAAVASAAPGAGLWHYALLLQQNQTHGD